MLSVSQVRDLLDTCTAATLTTYRRDGSAVATPVWFRAADDVVQVVIAETDAKLRRLRAGQHCSLTIFETVPPFRGIRLDNQPVISGDEVPPVRRAIASRYLGPDDGARFAEQRGPGVLVSWPLTGARTWDLRAILP